MGGAGRRHHTRGRGRAVMRVGLGRHERHHRHRHQAHDDRRYAQGVGHEPRVRDRPRPASCPWWPRRGGRRRHSRSGTGSTAGSRRDRARSRTPPGRCPRSRAACAAGRDRRPGTVTPVAPEPGPRSAGAAQRTRPACCGAERHTTGSSGGGFRQVGHTTGSQAPGRFRSIDRSSIPRYAQAVKSRGILFAVLALCLAGLSLASARHHVWVITAAALALALWMADLARRDLRAR